MWMPRAHVTWLPWEPGTSRNDSLAPAEMVWMSGVLRQVPLGTESFLKAKRNWTHVLPVPTSSTKQHSADSITAALCTPTMQSFLYFLCPTASQAKCCWWALMGTVQHRLNHWYYSYLLWLQPPLNLIVLRVLVQRCLHDKILKSFPPF